jgi:RNA polymerase sigma factor (sigma-70 family)
VDALRPQGDLYLIALDKSGGHRSAAAQGLNLTMTSEKQEIQYRTFWSKACEDSYSRLLSYARKLTNNNMQAAEDLAQDTVCRVLKYSSNPESIANPTKYLLRVLHNNWIDNLRHYRAVNEVSLDGGLSDGELPAVEPTVQIALEHKEVDDRFRDMMTQELRRLSARERYLLTSYLEGHNCKEIAAELGEDVSITRYNVNALKAKLRYRIAKAKFS